jgi:hypothetical protein
MEWEWFTTYFSKTEKEVAHTETMMDYLYELGFVPYTVDGQTELERKGWKDWPIDVLWINSRLWMK